VQRRVQLGVLAVDRDSDVLPDGQVVGSAAVKQRKQVGNRSGVGEFDDVAIAVEEFLEDAEVEHVNSHLGMVSMPMRLLRILRWIGLGVVGLGLVLFLVVQGQQRLLRHRAEWLHAEIVALQMHPGTFADVQRMQREWGKFGHWDGECTAHHCIYQIKLVTDRFQGRLDQIGASVTDGPDAERLWRRLERVEAFYHSVGRARVYAISANIRIRDDKMWGAGFGVGTYAYPGTSRRDYPGTGRNEGHIYVVFADVESSSRLLNDFEPDPDLSSLQRGFRTEYELQCLGCEEVTGYVALQTDPRAIERLNQFDFSCITRWVACKHPAELDPELWKQAVLERQQQPRPVNNNEEEAGQEKWCLVPSSVVAREANDILLVRVVAAKSIHDPESNETGQSATVNVLHAVKNGHRYRTSNQMVFGVVPHAVKQEAGLKGSLLEVGKKYFFLYDQRSPNSVFASPYLDPCHALLDNEVNAAEVRAGVLLDPSTGESYDYANDPDPGT